MRIKSHCHTNVVFPRKLGGVRPLYPRKLGGHTPPPCLPPSDMPAGKYVVGRLSKKGKIVSMNDPKSTFVRKTKQKVLGSIAKSSS